MRTSSLLLLLVAACGSGVAAQGPGASAATDDEGLDSADRDPNRRAGFGSLEVRGLRGMAAKVSHLDLARVDVAVEQDGDLAETRVEEVFANPTDTRLEGTFRFPLPDGAQLVGLAMEIDGRMVEGSLVERAKAEKVYQDVVDKMLDPALLVWEPGNVFKLRVFPIEPQSEKRIAIRYLAPLHHAGDAWSYVYPTAAAEMQAKIPHFRLVLDGQVVADATDFVPGHDVTARVYAAPHDVLSEDRADGSYFAVRLRPAFDSAATAVAGPRRVVVILDTSRSALEGRKLAVDAIHAVLGQLGSSDQLALLACDISCQKLDWTSDTNAALAWAGKLDFDGASDLAAMLAAAGKLGGSEVVYVGDGIATWGVTEPEALRTAAASALGGVPFYAVAVGKGAHVELLDDLAAASGGKAVHPSDLDEATRFARFLARAQGLPRLGGARLAAAGAEVYPRGPLTVYPGDDLVALVRVPAGAAPPAAITLDAGDVHQSFATVGAVPARHVAARWARARIAELEGLPGDHGDEIVKTSLDYGVLSRKTAFLVLESDEMWKQYQLERREAEVAQAGPHVSGGDLESLDGSRARLSPDDVQPGDPEIQVPAPRDAREVEVIFPFGETKLATWDEELAAWTVRFLIANDTPDGRYTVTVRITYADGHVETLRLPYTVDTHAPTVSVSMTQVGPGVYQIDAVQDAGDPAGLDARVIEVGVPGGQVLWLSSVGPGKFSGRWRTARHLGDEVPLRVVVEDRAQNQRADIVRVPLAR
jgi:hypothetical protein